MTKVHVGLVGKVRSADIHIEYKVPGESIFRMTTRPIHKLVLAIPVKEQIMEDEWEAAEQKEDKMATQEPAEMIPLPTSKKALREED
jgi:hypothetical protein